MKKTPSKRKPHVYRTAEERGRGDKVTESLAVYTRTRAAAQRNASIAASDAVWRFAARNDLIPHLETAVRLACCQSGDRDQNLVGFQARPAAPTNPNRHSRVRA